MTDAAGGFVPVTTLIVMNTRWFVSFVKRVCGGAFSDHHHHTSPPMQIAVVCTQGKYFLHTVKYSLYCKLKMKPAVFSDCNLSKVCSKLSSRTICVCVESTEELLHPPPLLSDPLDTFHWTERLLIPEDSLKPLHNQMTGAGWLTVCTANRNSWTSPKPVTSWCYRNTRITSSDGRQNVHF